MSDTILPLVKKFISIKSIPKNPKGLEEILELALLQVKDFTIEQFEQNGSKSALIYSGGKRPEKFDVLLSVHLDVIPGKDENYKPRVEGDKLFGVGALDMKANAACIIEVFKDVVDKVDCILGLQIGTDEQLGGFNGVKYQVEEGVRADFILASEPTNFDIVNKSKGVIWLKISAKGKTAHGAYPWMGENAILKINNFITTLNEKYPNPIKQKWVTTTNISTIDTDNKTYNKIPDNCVVGLDIRFISEDKDVILDEIKDLVPKDEGFEIDVLANESAMFTDEDNKYLKLLQKAGEEVTGKDIILRGAQGSSDARHFVVVGGSGVEFGAMGEDTGGDNECVYISSLDQYYQIIKKFLLTVNN